MIFAAGVVGRTGIETSGVSPVSARVENEGGKSARVEDDFHLLASCSALQRDNSPSEIKYQLLDFGPPADHTQLQTITVQLLLLWKVEKNLFW